MSDVTENDKQFHADLMDKVQERLVHLQDLQRQLVELDRRKDEVKKFFEDYKSTVDAIVSIAGVNHSFQDNQGIVYQLVEAEGKWVNFDRFIVERTKRPGETRGTLSVKKAKELGFTVKE
jgi:hypothetical protein